MATIITRIKEELVKTGIDPKTSPARTWIVQKMKSLTNPTRTDLFKDREALRTRTMIGRMYFYFYNPKTKETLPYWDRFPLVIPIMRYHDGFLGLNLHYIYPKDRLILLRKLSQYATGPLTDERTRLRLTYPILQATHRAFESTPCIKKYLYTHIHSRFLEIPANEWDIAAALPVQQFKSKTGITSQAVWAESKENY